MSKTAQYEYTGEEPLNREPKIKDLISSFLTNDSPYDRNHGPVQHIDASKHEVKIDGAVKNGISLTVNQLRTEFDQHEVICALQCAGNRRHTMRTAIKEVQGIDWFDGAVMNCSWRGPKLRDVLQKAGILDEMIDGVSRQFRGHAAFACYETEVQEDSWYGGSIELERAMNVDADVLLALEMNGEPLTPEHGAPVRVVVPGVAGARSVKWLNQITVQAQESENFYQQHDYKILPPEAEDKESAEKYWSQVPSLMDMPVNSIIGIPDSGSTVELDEDGTIEVRGYALPQGSDGPIRKVEVSGDDGKTWVEARLGFGQDVECEDEESQRKLRWAWCLWRVNLHMQKGTKRRIVSRATDRGGNSQPETAPWNLRGVAYNGWGEAQDLTIS